MLLLISLSVVDGGVWVLGLGMLGWMGELGGLGFECG